MNRRSFFNHFFGWVAGLVTFRFWHADGVYAAGTLQVNVSEHPELAEVGGSKLLKEVSIGDVKDNIVIVRHGEKEYVVVSAVCRHKKCNVKYKKDKDLFVCPCHGSTYDLVGKVQKGPSTTDITAYKATLNGNILTITPV